MIKALLIAFFPMSVLACHGQDSLVRYFHANGRLSSEGALMDGKPEGHWRNYYENGILRSEGWRKAAKLDSIWTFYDELGRRETEIRYRNDRKEGWMRQFDTLGTVRSVIPFVDDLREGLAVQYDEQGRKRKEIPYRSGKEEGRGFEYESDGHVTAVLYFGAGMLRRREDINQTDGQGLRQGPWKEFYPNGRVRWEGGFLDDKRHGIFKEYDVQGNLKEMMKYDVGVLDTAAGDKLSVEIKRTFHPNGRVASLGSYSKSGKREGLFKEFKLDGSIAGARIYQGDQVISEGLVNEAGAMEGPWVEYYNSGEKRAEGSYKEGKKE